MDLVFWVLDWRRGGDWTENLCSSFFFPVHFLKGLTDFSKTSLTSTNDEAQGSPRPHLSLHLHTGTSAQIRFPDPRDPSAPSSSPFLGLIEVREQEKRFMFSVFQTYRDLGMTRGCSINVGDLR